MLPTGLASFIATTTGKVVVGTAVAAATVGGAHTTDLVDVPLLPDGEATEIADDFEEIEDVIETPEPEKDADGTDGEDSAHGKAVSAVASTTDLEGCDKGQTIADLASSKSDGHRNDADDRDDPCAKADDGDSGRDLTAAAEDADEDEDDGDEVDVEDEAEHDDEDDDEDDEDDDDEDDDEDAGPGRAKDRERSRD